jgi:hypothetical protein
VVEEIKKLVDEILEGQKRKVLDCGRLFVPNLTTEDVLQPVDYPELENNPAFRYEEGVLEGIHTVRAALLALFRSNVRP